MNGMSIKFSINLVVDVSLIYAYLVVFVVVVGIDVPSRLLAEEGA